MQEDDRSNESEHEDESARDEFGANGADPKAVTVRSTATTILLVLAALVAIYVAKPVLLAVAFAWLFSTALSPVVRALTRWHIRPEFGAALIVLALSAVVVFGVYQLTSPVAKWIEDLPAQAGRIQSRVEGLISDTTESVKRATEQVEKLTEEPDEPKPVEVKIDGEPTLAERLFSEAGALLANLAITVVLMYFMLAASDGLLQKTVSLSPRLRDKRIAVTTLRAIEQRLGHYFLAVTCINVGLGIAVGFAMAAIGMPNPALWGVLAGVANFVPYLGPTFGIIIVAGASILEFEAISEAILPPAAYLVLNLCEGFLVTPAVLGRTFALSPVAILVWLLLWSWLWGIPGALLAVPFLAAIKIVCDHVPRLSSIATFIGR